MKQILVMIFFIASIINLSGQTKQTDIPWPPLADTPWPMVKHDPQFTGRSKFKGPQNGTVIWRKDLPDGIFSGPVLDKESNLFFGSYYQGKTSDYFYSYTKDGEPRWTFNLGRKRPPQSGILIDSSNTIYFGSLDSNFYAINPDGTLKWKVHVGSMIVELAMPNIDLNGNLYITNFNGELCSISPKGELNWKVKHENGFFEKSPVFAPDGQTMYIAGKDSNLFALDLSGSIKWKLKCGKIYKSPIVDNNGNLYFCPLQTNEVSIYSFCKDGTLRWKHTLFDSIGYFDAFSVPALDYDGNIYFVGVDTLSTDGVLTYHRALMSISNEGNFRWSYTFQDFFEDIWQPLICDSEGTVYVGSTFGLLYYAISKDGELKWTIRLNENQVDNTGAIAEDGTLYIGTHITSLSHSNTQNLIAIKDTGSVDINEDVKVIKEYSLSQNYPNPFNPSTTIKYSIPSVGEGLALTLQVILKVFDILGREVATLVNEEQAAGNYEVQFNVEQSSNLSSGVYFYKLQVGSFSETKKMILLR